MELLDWGSVGQMNIAQAFYGVLCACETALWEAHKSELLALFVAEYRRHGGPAVPVEEFSFNLDLFIAMLGMAWMIDAPSIIAAQIPDLASVRDRHDPRLRDNFLARAQLQLMVVFLSAWERGVFGATLERFLRR